MSFDAASNGGHLARAEGPLNGGGEILHLRTVAGNIRVVASDAAKTSAALQATDGTA